ncbi:MAG: hypothetical protein FGM16_10720 [Flavobacterium sp.]|nr:hypothetical protein [Flavobacterium sp.]
MKHLVFVFTMLLSNGAICQVQDSLVWRYANIIYPLGGFTSKAKATIDYGEENTAWFKRDQVIEDEQGKEVKFKSAIDALNFMSVRGWELVTTYQTNESHGIGTPLIYQHFIVRRREEVK